MLTNEHLHPSDSPRRDAADCYEKSWEFGNQAGAAGGFKLAFNYLKAKRCSCLSQLVGGLMPFGFFPPGMLEAVVASEPDVSSYSDTAEKYRLYPGSVWSIESLSFSWGVSPQNTVACYRPCIRACLRCQVCGSDRRLQQGSRAIPRLPQDTRRDTLQGASLAPTMSTGLRHKFALPSPPVLENRWGLACSFRALFCSQHDTLNLTIFSDDPDHGLG